MQNSAPDDPEEVRGDSRPPASAARPTPPGDPGAAGPRAGPGLAEALAAAEAASRAKDAFLATLSHELRTPLTSIVGWAAMLKAGSIDAAASVRALQTIERNARMLVRLVDDLLDVSRIEADKIRLELAATDPAGVVRAAVDACRPVAEQRGVVVEATVGEVPASLTADPDRLQQVVANLLSNALKFTPRGRRVEVRLDRHAGGLRLRVIDEGQGIAADFLPRVFERFQQADGSLTRAHGGLGLGLAIVKHLVELHGGTVAAASEGAGRGATFTVTLPLEAGGGGAGGP